jgi:AcrR family transcriptional regulator
MHMTSIKAQARTPAAREAAAPRRRGRPADSGARDLRREILDAAEALFAERGFAATPVRQIAERVGVTPAMIHYYFGSKTALFREVFDQALLPLASAIGELRASGRSVLEGFPGLVMRLALEHPHLPALVTREVFLPGGQMQQHFAANLAPRLGGALPGLLAAEQASGRVSSQFEPRATALLLIAMCIFPFIARPLAEKVLGVRYDAEGVAHLDAQLRLLLQRGLRP